MKQSISVCWRMRDTFTVLWEALENKLKGSLPDGPDLLKLYEDVELPLILALLDMECRGIRVNQTRAARILPHLEKVLEILKEKIPAKAKSIFVNGNAEANEEDLESAGDKYVNKIQAHWHPCKFPQICLRVSGRVRPFKLLPVFHCYR